ncbi:MAG: peptidase T [Oscillospiraceae bacterium]|nr:peptidase T [Oscillospiraceae bacterium]
MNALDRFLNYVTVETTSSEKSQSRPSTPGQRNLTDQLAREMRELGLTDVHISEADGAAFGTIPANTDRDLPSLGFLAHVDTSEAASGKNARARIVKDYDGGRIMLSDTVSMSPEDGFTGLLDVVGEDLIVTDGTTLLGADDKAGVAEIMTMAELLMQSERPHGTVKVAFTTDEEIGAGPDLFDVKRFGCDFAYTVDGGPLGELEYENFNAASAEIRFHGVGVHPGDAKNKMKNAASIAAEYQMLLPGEQVPEHTEGYEGFIHLTEMSGDVVSAQLRYILRDHDLHKLRIKEKLMEDAAAYLNRKYGPGTVETELKETYYNMREKVEPHRHLIETAQRAFVSQGVEPKTVPIRGGTDGARLSFMGLPCPNLSTGGYQFHGIYEFIPVRALETMPKVLLEIVYAYGGAEKYVSETN